jgi:hypothetical protein
MVYAYALTETSKSALLELGIALNKYHDDIVLSGGWAPYFITNGYFNHCGSQDIDLVLKTEIMLKYETIRDILEELGYIPVAYRPFQFTRRIKSHIDGSEYDIRLDILCEKEGTENIDIISGCHDVQQDLTACVFDGLSIAFDFNFEQEIEAVLPDNRGIAKTSIKVIDLVGSLALKGKAFVERYNAKDAYDIFALTHYKGGPAHASQYFNETISGKVLSATKQKLLKQSIININNGFKDKHQRGPFDVESFSEQKYNRDIVAAQVRQFLEKISYT